MVYEVIIELDRARIGPFWEDVEDLEMYIRNFVKVAVLV
jgi:hypothetical protein